MKVRESGHGRKKLVNKYTNTQQQSSLPPQLTGKMAHCKIASHQDMSKMIFFLRSNLRLSNKGTQAQIPGTLEHKKS